MALAGYAHGFSTGAERIVERRTVGLGEERPRGEYWHGNLRHQMADAQTRRRPAVIDEPWRARLREYLRFRSLRRGGGGRAGRYHMRVVEVPENLDKEAFAEKARAIYAQRYKDRLEATVCGKVIAIEVESGEIFIGRTVLEAAMQARRKFPARLLYFIRGGYPAVHSLQGTGTRLSTPEKT